MDLIIIMAGVSNIIENVLFDDAEEDVNEEHFLIELGINKLRDRINREMRRPNRIPLYFENVVPGYSAQEFQSHFRISLQAFEHLITKVGPLLESGRVVGRQTTDPRKQLLAVLWLLATPDSFRSVGERFDLGKSTLSSCFYRVICSLNKIAPEIIKWPQREEIQGIEISYRNWARLQGVIGAIDGTYVPIKAPKENPETYINRKCFHGITLQAICISSLKFTNCFAGYPSSVGDQRIFKNSDIYLKFLTNPEEYFNEGTYIIGDKAYPIIEWCMVPFIDRGNLTVPQINFNTALAKTRQVIERAFALLFGRFRRLKYLDMNRTDWIPATVIACCVLHNLCLNAEDIMVNQYIEEGQPFMENNNDPPHEEIIEDITIQGLVRRDQITRMLDE